MIKFSSSLSSLFAVVVVAGFISSLAVTAAEQTNHDIEWIIPSNGKPYAPIGIDNGTGDDDVIVVGDTVTFTWPGQHNVVIHPSGTCDDTDGAYLGSTSPLQYTFEKEGVYTFSCDVGMGTHCRLGQIINVTVTEMSETEREDKAEDEETVLVNDDEDRDEQIVNGDDDDESSSSYNYGEYNETEILKGYQEFFNPGEEQRVLEYRIKPYKIPHEVTTYVDFLFNIPPDMIEEDKNQIVHVVTGDVINSQPKHLHHFVLNGCTEAIDPAQEGIPASGNRHLMNCNIPLGAWAVGGNLYQDIPRTRNAGQVFGPGLGIKALNINMHYTDGLDVILDDPNSANDGEYAIATDGIRIMFTPDLRSETMLNKPLINVGFPQSVAMNVPPKESRYFYTKTCTVESSCKDAADETMQRLGRMIGQAGMEDMSCESVKAFCFLPTGLERYLQMLCPVSCGLCDVSSSENEEYYLNAMNYHAHMTGREMYATLLPSSNNAPSIDLKSRDFWSYDDQVSYPLTTGNDAFPYVTVRHGDKIQVTCVFNSMSRDKLTYFGLSTYDEMCITQASMIIDTPDMSSENASLMAMLALKSFSCAVDKQDDHDNDDDDDAHYASSSDIWRGSLLPGEDARQIYINHPMSQSDCTYPVGAAHGGGLSTTGDTVPTGDAHCVSTSPSDNSDEKMRVDIICVSAIGSSSSDGGFTFDPDAIAGEHCEGGSFDEKDSNDPSLAIAAADDGNTNYSFREMCTSGGGQYEPYTCKDAENFMNGWDAMFMLSDMKEFMRIDWWQPKCCINNNDDTEQDEEEQESSNSRTMDIASGTTFYSNLPPRVFLFVSVSLALFYVY